MFTKKTNRFSYIKFTMVHLVFMQSASWISRMKKTRHFAKIMDRV